MYDEDDSEENGFLLCVKLPDLKSQTRIVVRRNQTVYSAKQALLSKITGVYNKTACEQWMQYQ